MTDDARSAMERLADDPYWRMNWGPARDEEVRVLIASERFASLRWTGEGCRDDCGPDCPSCITGAEIARAVAALTAARDEAEQRAGRLAELIATDHIEGAFFSCDECGTSFGNLKAKACPVCALRAVEQREATLREEAKAVYVVQRTDYDERSILAAFTDPVAAEAYRVETEAAARTGEYPEHGTFSVFALPVDAPRSDLPGAWLVRVGPTGDLLCEPDWVVGEATYQFGRATSEGGYTTGEGWEGGAQAYGLTVEEARAKAWGMVRARSAPGGTTPTEGAK